MKNARFGLPKCSWRKPARLKRTSLHAFGLGAVPEAKVTVGRTFPTFCYPRRKAQLFMYFNLKRCQSVKFTTKIICCRKREKSPKFNLERCCHLSNYHLLCRVSLRGWPPCALLTSCFMLVLYEIFLQVTKSLQDLCQDVDATKWPQEDLRAPLRGRRLHRQEGLPAEVASGDRGRPKPLRHQGS